MMPARRRSHSKPPDDSWRMLAGRTILGLVPMAISQIQNRPGSGKHGYWVAFDSSSSSRQAAPYAPPPRMPVIRARSTSTSMRGNGRLKWLSVPAMTPVVSSSGPIGVGGWAIRWPHFGDSAVVVPGAVAERRVQDGQAQVRALGIGQQQPRARVVGDPRPGPLVDEAVEVAREQVRARPRSGP